MNTADPKDILSVLGNADAWETFLEYKRLGGHMSASEEKALTSFVENREYEETVRKICAEKAFPHPSVTVINKKGSTKKRIVFTFPEAENNVLKLIGFLLGRYDGLFCDNLYSFRRDTGVKKAIADLKSVPGISRMYSYKTDIHDYFGSVHPELMIPVLHGAIDANDAPLADIIAEMLTDPVSVRNGEEISVQKGIMAGVPTSAFLADLFLSDLDASFFERGIPYARYSDDIIVFAETKEKLEEYEREILSALAGKGLTVNPAKEKRTLPGEGFEYLGFFVDGDKTDISRVAADKLKKKLKRKAEALLRWKQRNAAKGADDERALRAFFRYCSKKLFDNPIKNEITWCRWYFPIITADDTLKELDRYILDLARHVASGRWSASGYKISYEQIKKYGYQSLVNRFYRFKKGDVIK
ncbi:MAG: hypothetical protein MJ137_04740 [Clostridia bacterium]|nr:hypothetical protein [Clostridia bacterium]